METLEQIGTLHTIAQVAITLVGFTGIVLVFGERSSLKLGESEYLRILSMVAPTLVVLLGCFVPILLIDFTDNEVVIWRISNGIYGTLHLYPVTSFLLNKAKKTKGQNTAMIFGYLTILANYLTAFGLIPWPASIFFFGLLCVGDGGHTPAISPLPFLPCPMTPFLPCPQGGSRRNTCDKFHQMI